MISAIISFGTLFMYSLGQGKKKKFNIPQISNSLSAVIQYFLSRQCQWSRLFPKQSHTDPLNYFVLPVPKSCFLQKCVYVRLCMEQCYSRGTVKNLPIYIQDLTTPILVFLNSSSYSTLPGGENSHFPSLQNNSRYQRQELVVKTLAYRKKQFSMA